MTVSDIALLLAAGVVGGVTSSIAGGAAIFTFPALLATGMPPTVAIAVNTAVLTPSQFLAALYDRSQLPPFDRSFMLLVLAALIGGPIGATLLLLTPEKMFVALVPLLLGLATALFAFAGRISTWMSARGSKNEALGEPNDQRVRAESSRRRPFGRFSLAMMWPISIYGGYFGAGLGVLILGVMSVATGGDYRSANVAKNLVASLNSLAATVLFAVQGAVAWPAALVMIAGSLVGALLGARLAQVMPNHTARTIVIAVGALLTVVFAWRYWF
jgi:uncharacterized membrane protein YfcA